MADQARPNAHTMTTLRRAYDQCQMLAIALRDLRDPRVDTAQVVRHVERLRGEIAVLVLASGADSPEFK